MNGNFEMQKKEEIESTVKKVLKVIGFSILGIIFVVGIGFVVMWLWNWLMTDIFALRKINYWEAVGIFVFAKIIFGFGRFNSSDDKSKGKIRKEVSREFDKELDKEVEKEFQKEMEKSKE